MPNEQNLVPNEQRSEEERRANARKAGKASGEARRRKKLMREAFDELLERDYTDANGSKIDGTSALAVKVFKQAMSGNLKAFEIIRDTVGEMPIQRLEVDTIDPQARAEMDELLGVNND